MTKTATPTTYCVKLYCDQPSLLKGLYKPDFDLYMRLRDDVEALVKSCGNKTSVTWLGSCAHTTTWEVADVCMPRLLSKLKRYNNDKLHQHIIHIEVY